LKLESQKRAAWHNIVTLEESWFYFGTDHEPIWLQPSEEVPGRERPTKQSKEMMRTKVWNQTDFHLINDLENGCKFNSTHYVAEVLSPLSEWRRNQAGVTRSKVDRSCRSRAPAHGANFFDVPGRK
jgi:hypothetical protein